jgi:hypothetical protein
VVEIGHYRPPSGNNKAETADFRNRPKMAVFSRFAITGTSDCGHVRSVLNEKCAEKS